MGEKKLAPGQIWIGKCLSSYEPDLWFAYVLLSAKEEDGILWWSAAGFMRGVYGAPVKKFTEEEIRKLSYRSHIVGNWFCVMVRKILIWVKKNAG